MARLHGTATLVPTKRELLDAWLPHRPWFDGVLERGPVASFRLDDPEGEVGMEGFLLGSAMGTTLFVPLSYRPTPLDGADRHLVGTMQHSVLGTRWVYDGCGDPAWARALTAAVLGGGAQADEDVEVDGAVHRREPSARVRGTGRGSDVPTVATVRCRDDGPVTVVDAGPLELVVVRVVGTAVDADETLRASWAGGQDVVLAGVRRR